MSFKDYGIYAYNGPNWDRDLKTICDNFPAEYCYIYTSITGNQGQAVLSELYWNKNALADRFQEPISDADWKAGKHTSDMVPISNIKKVPISMFVATADETCPHATALKYIPQIQSETVRIDVEMARHEYFHTEANS